MPVPHLSLPRQRGTAERQVPLRPGASQTPHLHHRDHVQAREGLEFVMLVVRQPEDEVFSRLGDRECAKQFIPDRQQKPVVAIVVTWLYAMVQLVPVWAEE